MKQHFEILMNFVFPKLHDFTYNTNLGNFRDADMSRMIEAFPNLRTFSPQGFFTGKYIERFHHLQNLTLTHCKTFEVKYLIRILETRRLKTLKLGVFAGHQIQNVDLPMDGITDLEVLLCNVIEMNKLFLGRLKHLTHLQQLTLRGSLDSSLLKSVLLSGNRSRVKSLEINIQGIFVNELYCVLDLNIQFETLKLENIIIMLMGCGNTKASLENVNQIHLISCAFAKEIDLQVLISLKSPEIVALDGCRFNFNEYTFVANDIAKGRRRTLHLYLDSEMLTLADVQSDFVRLPDDVLILILEKLDLVNQLKMTHVHIRFLVLMPQVWRLQCSSTTLSLFELHLSDKDLRFFLGSNQETFRVLRLKMEKRMNFDILTGYIFPNVHDFRFSTYSFKLHDSDMPRIIRTFPNLKTFSPHGGFTGKHMQDFPKLENLKLSHCSAKVRNLIHILRTHKLKGLQLCVFDDEHFTEMKLPLEGIQNLEVLECNIEEIAGWFLEPMEQLAKLKKLLLWGVVNWHVLGNVLNSSHRKSVKSVQLNPGDMRIFDLFRGLTVQVETLQVSQALIVFNEMFYINNISQVYFRKCAVPRQNYFDVFLNRSKTLKTLGLDGCIFGFKDYTFSVREIVQNRNTALHVHLNRNEYLVCAAENVAMQWNVEGEHSLFKLHEGPLNITYGCEPVAIYFE